MQCKTCHRIGGKGTEVGPDLDGIGKKYDRAQILENILDPSKQINVLRKNRVRMVSMPSEKQD